jgi:hypothetical protein
MGWRSQWRVHLTLQYCIILNRIGNPLPRSCRLSQTAGSGERPALKLQGPNNEAGMENGFFRLAWRQQLHSPITV